MFSKVVSWKVMRTSKCKSWIEALPQTWTDMQMDVQGTPQDFKPVTEK